MFFNFELTLQSDVSIMRITNCQQLRNFFKKSYNLGKCELIRELGKVSDARMTVPDHIVKPSYYETLNEPSRTDGNIEIKNDEQISGMRASCKLAANILKKCNDIVKVTNRFNLSKPFLNNISSSGWRDD